MLAAAEIVTFEDDRAPNGASPFVGGYTSSRNVQVVAADPSWPEHYEMLAKLIRGTLGDRVLALEHIGSTAVPGLPAKPIIDIDLTVAESADEASYVPRLERAGFVLVIREWWWYGHRLLRNADPACHLHVFSPDCPETARHRIFRDWLRSHPEDRGRYARAKAAAARETNLAGGHTMDYNARKEATVREIYGRAFRDLGLIN
jgi:GrpB-like predicted nucleotidyltransferase (UPF0157 family)